MPNRKFYRPTVGGHNIKIGDRLLNINVARLVYRCEVCHEELVKVEFGLKCKASAHHRGFIHRDEVTQINEQQQQNVNELQNVYEIVDGKVIVKDGN